MTQPTSEDPIRERFQRLRNDTERGSVPDFQAMLDQAREGARRAEQRPATTRTARRRRILWAGGLASAAVAAALAAVLLTDYPSDPDEEFELLVASFASDASAGAWRSPTSALLDVPGSDLIRSLPSVGETARDMDPRQPPGERL